MPKRYLPREPKLGYWRAALAALAVLVFAAGAFAQSDDDGAIFPKKKKNAATSQTFGQAPRAVGAFEQTFGNPPGSGAGKTGFVSQKKSAKKKAQSKNAAVAASSRAQNRNPSLARAQATALETTGTVSRPLRRRLAAEAEPYGPVGFRAGTFILRPSVELQTGYDSNALRVPNGPASRFDAVVGQLLAKSDWSRHEASLDLRGSFTRYTDVDGADRPDLLGVLRGRVDVTSLSRIELESKFAITTENPGSPDAIATVKRQPNLYSFGTTAAYVQRFNRFEVTAGVGIERNTYENADLTNGAVVSLADRDYTAYSARLRGAYEWSPDAKPFLEVAADRRERDLAVDFNGVRRDSSGSTIRAGITFGRQERLSGEISAGFAQRSYNDPTLNDISGLIFDSSLVWRATGLTTVTLNASSGIDETSVLGASGILRREARVIVDHAFRRWLIGSASIGFTSEEYRGDGLVNDYLRTSVALTYHLNRSLALKAEYRNERLFSNVPGQDYTANIGLVGVRLQR